MIVQNLTSCISLSAHWARSSTYCRSGRANNEGGVFPAHAGTCTIVRTQPTYVCNVHGRWETVPEDQPCSDWARGFFRDATPFATGGVYVNFLTDDEVDRIRVAYGPGYDRLVAIKKKYDPDNLFRMNQNIRPEA